MDKNQSTSKQPSYLFATPVQIRFTDIDQLGHVTNSVYQQYYDMGRLTYFGRIFEEQMDWNVEGLVLVNLSIDFISPIKLFHKVEVRSKIYAIGVKSIKMRQEIFNHTTNCTSSKSTSTMVACKNSCSESIVIPERWVKSVMKFEPDVLTTKVQ